MFEWIKNAWAWAWHTDSWPPRETCGEWTDGLIAWHNTCGAVIAVCYVAIPVLSFTLLRRWAARLQHWGRAQRGLGPIPMPVGHIYLAASLSAAFVVSCGLTHVTGDVMMFETPAYNLHGLALTHCAMWSVLCASYLGLEVSR